MNGESMLYIDIKDDYFYDDAVVMVKSFYPRMEVARLKEDTILGEQDTHVRIEVPDVTGLNKKEAHDLFKEMLYKKLSKDTNKTLPWGNLTGVRPSKIAYTMLEDNASEEDIIKHFTNQHFASEKKASLALNVAKKEMSILNKLDCKTGYSLYIGVPFCPSICLYCSFSSFALDAYKTQVDAYVDALIKELRYVGSAMKDCRLDTIYMGGGTPTTLSAAQLDRVLTEVENTFDLSKCFEITVEAGRPDSVDMDKFLVLKKHNVSRISINPQTMNQKTLDLIGRKHTVSDVYRAFDMARKAGLNNINMDMILGLPGEGVEEVAYTLSEIESLSPESLTVHSLAIKRASRLNILRQQYAEVSIENTDRIVDMTHETAKRLGMEPYYMYRQKNIAGNYENVGFSKPGLECAYNIVIMEEKQTIIACGAGASSKIVFQGIFGDESYDNKSVRIERIENVKDVKNYIDRIDEMIERKRNFYKPERE